MARGEHARPSRGKHAKPTRGRRAAPGRLRSPKQLILQRLIAISLVLGLALSGLLVWGASYAAFTATTSNTGNSIASASVVISDDDSGGTLFALTNLAPGDTGQRCIRVTYTGSTPSSVGFYATSVSGAPAPYIQLVVEEGLGAGSYSSCTGFVTTALIYQGTVSGLAASASNFSTGLGSFAPNITGQTRNYRITYTVDPAAPGSAGDSTATATFNWEAQNSTHATMKGTGRNDNGQLGVGNTTSPVTSYTAIGSNTDWTSMTAGYRHSCGVRANSTAWCWGENTNGRLGVGDTTQRTSPVQAGSATTWRTIVAGYTSTCGLQSTGSLWCWGLNSSYQLGLGDTTQRTSPVQVGAGTYSQVAVGGTHACAVATDGTLWCWGDNTNGRLGVGDTTQRTTPAQVGSATDWVTIALGYSYSCGIRASGSLWCWGYNNTGQLGLADTTQRTSPVQVGSATWSTVAAGWGSTCGIQRAGTLYCWGFNDEYQLGLNDVTQRTSPVQVGVATNWAQLSRGWGHACAARADRTVYCWGDGAQGKLGFGDTTARQTPTLLNGVSVAALWQGGLAEHSFLINWPT